MVGVVTTRGAVQGSGVRKVETAALRDEPAVCVSLSMCQGVWPQARSDAGGREGTCHEEGDTSAEEFPGHARPSPCLCPNAVSPERACGR